MSCLYNVKSNSVSGYSDKSSINDPKVWVKEIKSHCSNRLVMDNLKINSTWNKFDALSHIVDNKVDILIISESKLGNSLLPAQFFIHGFTSPYGSDRKMEEL